MAAKALTIAGSDPSGGAGIQADLKVFHQHGAYGMSVLTLLTVQNTQKVEEVMLLDKNFVLRQLDAVLSDIKPNASKTGALGNAEIVDMLSWRAENFDFPLVVDPVMISKHGNRLIEEDGCEVLKKHLLGRAFLVTPNIPEAEYLSERNISDLGSMEKAAASIALLGAKNVLIKGGHLNNDSTDVLLAGKEVCRFTQARIDTKNTHGTGCVYSAAITARLSKGEPLIVAVRKAKEYVTEAITTNPEIGRGFGPTNMHAKTA